MKVLFLTMGDFQSITDHSIYPDLLRCFITEGNEVYVIAPGKTGEPNSCILKDNKSQIVHVPLNNLTGSRNLIKKGFSQISVGLKYILAIKKFFNSVKFDLVLYSTPPITLVPAIKYVKKRDSARTYLLLKDIFPQNAVDLGMLSTKGVKGFLYKYFRNQEKRLYKISDRIGCMSQANVDYVLRHNTYIDPSIVEICPNSIEVIDKKVDSKSRVDVRIKYGIPLNKKIFVYGGNLGKPQGIPFLIECLKKCKEIEDAFFLIVGDGTEYYLLENYVATEHPKHVKLMKKLPKENYETLIGACDVGMIFLDHRFTIPNFPSRILAYMQAKLPVLACTDPNTDIGKVITEGGFGWWCESNAIDAFSQIVETVINTPLDKLGKNGNNYLLEHYTDKIGYRIINN